MRVWCVHVRRIPHTRGPWVFCATQIMWLILHSAHNVKFSFYLRRHCFTKITSRDYNIVNNEIVSFLVLFLRSAAQEDE